MQHKLLQRPDFGMVEFVFDGPGEKVVVEAGAMVGRDTNISMETNMRGGLLAAAKRSMLGGESVFQNTFTSSAAGERIQIAPPAEGDVMHFGVTPDTPIFLQSGAYLACTEGIELDTKWGGAKGFFSGTGAFLLKAEGQGDLFIASYGAIHKVAIGQPNTPGANGYTVDTGHILAFTAGVNYNVERVKGLKSFLGSGEGLIAKFHGQGYVYLTTRNPTALASFLYPYRPRQQN